MPETSSVDMKFRLNTVLTKIQLVCQKQGYQRVNKP